jgi:hypothetical protein
MTREELAAWEAKAVDVLNKFGFLVIGSSVPLEIGYITYWEASTGSVQPFRIVAPSTREEFVAQDEIFGPSDAVAETYFYRVVTE